MIFEILAEAAEKNELILLNGGMLHYHCRKDGTVTIREILVVPIWRKKGVGKVLLKVLRERVPAVRTFVARCPADLPSNGFWRHQGFVLTGTTTGKRPVNTWRLQL